MIGLKFPRTLRLPTMLVAVAQVQPALAQELEQDSIIVTGERPAMNPYGDEDTPYKVDRLAGTKIVVPLLDLPRTVTVIPREVIEDQGALSFRDLVRVQPGITLGTGEGGNAYGDRTFIRGFDARNDVYIDGFRDPGVTNREVFAVQQIEVIKGPSATYGGRGTTGGSINFVTKQPQNATFAAANATVGTDETQRITADVNYGISDRVQIRVNGLYHDSEVSGRDEVWQERWGVFAAGTWKPVDGVEVGLDYYHLTWDALPDWGMPFDSRSQQPFEDTDRSNWYGVKQRDFLSTEVDYGTFKFDWKINETFELASIARLSSNLNSYIASAPEQPVITDPNPLLWTVRANPKSRNARSEFFGNMTTLRVNLDSPGVAQTLVFGAEASSEKVENRPFAFAQSETVGSPVVPAVVITHNLFNPDPNVAWTLFRTLSGAYTRATVDSYGFYVLDTIELTPQLQISGGIRYDDYVLQLVSRGAPSTAVPVPVALRLTQHDTFWNWNAGLVFKPVPSVSLYISANTSSNPSGEQTDGAAAAYGGLTIQSVNLAPERNRAYEIGAKWEPAGALLLTAALFRTTKENARVAVVGGTGATPLELSGRQRVQGVEFGVAGNITPEWSVYGGYAYLDSEVLDARNPANVGQMFPNIPKHSGSLMSNYDVTGWLTVGGQASYYSKRFGGNNLSNASGTVVGGVVTGQPTLPAYWRFDANARIAVNDALELQINGLNLSNKRYYEALYQSASPFSYQAPGRTVLGTVRVVF